MLFTQVALTTLALASSVSASVSSCYSGSANTYVSPASFPSSSITCVSLRYVCSSANEAQVESSGLATSSVGCTSSQNQAGTQLTVFASSTLSCTDFATAVASTGTSAQFYCCSTANCNTLATAPSGTTGTSGKASFGVKDVKMSSALLALAAIPMML